MTTVEKVLVFLLVWLTLIVLTGFAVLIARP